MKTRIGVGAAALLAAGAMAVAGVGAASASPSPTATASAPATGQAKAAKSAGALQADVTTLKDAPAADRVKDAYKIKTTALSGGYGPEVQKRAEALEKTVTG